MQFKLIYKTKKIVDLRRQHVHASAGREYKSRPFEVNRIIKKLTAKSFFCFSKNSYLIKRRRKELRKQRNHPGCDTRVYLQVDVRQG